MARASQRYIAVIADMVRSRELPRSRRRVLQKHFSRLIATLNRDYRKAIAARFVITLGDEFQGVLKSAALIPDLIWRLEQDFPERELRVGVGFGILDTPLQRYAINIDGPVLHRRPRRNRRRQKVQDPGRSVPRLRGPRRHPEWDRQTFVVSAFPLDSFSTEYRKSPTAGDVTDPSRKKAQGQKAGRIQAGSRLWMCPIYCGRKGVAYDSGEAG